MTEAKLIMAMQRITDAIEPATLTRDGEVAIITVAKAECESAYLETLAPALLARFNEFSADDSLRVAVFFADPAVVTTPIDFDPHNDAWARLVAALRAPGRKPIVSATEGRCIAECVTFALACDARVFTADSTFVFPRRLDEPAFELTASLASHLLGIGPTLELFLLDEPLRAQWALESGLATEIVAPGQALTAAIRIAHRLSSPVAA